MSGVGANSQHPMTASMFLEPALSTLNRHPKAGIRRLEAAGRIETEAHKLAAAGLGLHQ
jgi:hypothetical protein